MHLRSTSRFSLRQIGWNNEVICPPKIALNSTMKNNFNWIAKLIMGKRLTKEVLNHLHLPSWLLCVINHFEENFEIFFRLRCKAQKLIRLKANKKEKIFFINWWLSQSQFNVINKPINLLPRYFNYWSQQFLTKPPSAVQYASVCHVQ